MAAEYICDGCGRREPAEVGGIVREYFKPSRWFQRADEDGIQDACSRPCIERVAKASGKSPAILPI